MEKIELLSPAGDMEKLKTALYFGADACYLAGKNFGLRAFSSNFTQEELIEAVTLAHEKGKKIYVTLNILAHNIDFEGLEEYVKFLDKIKIDAVIISDIGILSVVKKAAPNLEIHISTQASITNKYSALEYVKMGAKRLVLARELSLEEIKEIRDYLPEDIVLETFIHGAMCISYSGRCLLSNYLTNRDSNRGACVQACRWEYCIREKNREDYYEIQEDNRGTYILNSKDLNMIEYIKELYNAGVTSFKIEGRMKSPYYVATVTNAYRRAIDDFYDNRELNKSLLEELDKTSHRKYTTGFYHKNNNKENLESSNPTQTHEFIAKVKEDSKNGYVLIEQRNRFKVGDTLEVLSPNDNFNKQIVVEELLNTEGAQVLDANRVQQPLYLKTNLNLKANDILRKKVD
ncbi:MAG: U32 family peptidase [Clostridiales bacterium]|nr:U32 family peptidase [Clostridiales bacterium]